MLRSTEGAGGPAASRGAAAPAPGGGGGGAGEAAARVGGSNETSRRPRVLLGVSGSVATIKLPQLAALLCEWADVRVVATAGALHFVDAGQLPGEALPLLGDEDEWRAWKAVGDPVMHIELRRWADVFVIAPLSANTMAKIVHGLCDNLLTCVARAWDFSKPMLVAPAMNTAMWDHPLTGQQLQALEMQLGVDVVPPVSKRLACGDVGVGAMAAPETVCAAVRRAVEECRAAQAARGAGAAAHNGAGGGPPY